MMPTVQVSDGWSVIGVTSDSERITNPPPQVCPLAFYCMSLGVPGILFIVTAFRQEKIIDA